LETRIKTLKKDQELDHHLMCGTPNCVGVQTSNPNCAEHTCLRAALREAIPLEELYKELQQHGFNYTATKLAVLCELFEDNNIALEEPRVPMVRPRITILLMVFTSSLQQAFNQQERKSSILIMKTDDQYADILSWYPLRKYLSTDLHYEVIVACTNQEGLL
jgi:hypothetical protein